MREAKPPNSETRGIVESLKIALRYRTARLSPVCFTVNMGTGMVSLLLFNLPYSFQGARTISLIVFALNVSLFFAFTTMSIFRYSTLFPGLLSATIKDPEVLLLAAFPMGASTIISYGALAFSDSPLTIQFAFYLWWIQAFVACSMAFLIPFSMYKSKHRLDPSTLNAIWIQPTAAPVIAAASGSIVATALTSPDQVRAIVVASYVILGLGVGPTFFLMVIYLKRLILFGIPKQIVFSSFLPVGPCGQTAYAILQLGGMMRQVSVSLFAAEESRIVGLAIYGVSIVIALPFWGVGVFWLALASSSVLDVGCREGIPFNLGWFGCTFPIGTMATSSLLLYNALNLEGFRAISMFLSVTVIFVWIYLAGRIMWSPWGWEKSILSSSAFDEWERERRAEKEF